MNTRRRRHINLAVQRDRNRVVADVHAARAATSAGGDVIQVLIIPPCGHRRLVAAQQAMNAAERAVEKARACPECWQHPDQPRTALSISTGSAGRPPTPAGRAGTNFALTRREARCANSGPPNQP